MTAPTDAPLLPTVVADRARRDPAAVAVSSPDRTITAGQLYDDAGALAAAFLDNGLRPGVRVVLWLQNDLINRHYQDQAAVTAARDAVAA